MRPLYFVPLVLCAASSARADDVDVELTSKAFAGKSKPAVVVKINRAVQRVELAVTRPGGKVADAKGPLTPGSVAKFELDAPVGMTHYEGTLRVTFAGGSGGAMPLAFDVEVVDRFVITTAYDKLDLAKGEVQI